MLRNTLLGISCAMVLYKCLVQTCGPYHRGRQRDTKVQKYVCTMHRKVGVGWYM